MKTTSFDPSDKPETNETARADGQSGTSRLSLEVAVRTDENSLKISFRAHLLQDLPLDMHNLINQKNAKRTHLPCTPCGPLHARLVQCESDRRVNAFW